MRLVPNSKPFQPAQIRTAFQIGSVAVVPGATRQRVQLTTAGSSPMMLQIIARPELAGVKLSPAFQVAELVLKWRTNAALVRDAQTLTGQAARRPLRARTALFTYDVKKLALVKKGDLVTLTYVLPGIELSSQGQAQADAAQGETVAVLNTRSRRTVEGRVTGAGTVTVTSPGATLAAAR